MDYVQGQLCPIAMDPVRECSPYGIYSLARIRRNNGHQGGCFEEETLQMIVK